MKVLMIDVGGSHVKFMGERDGEMRKLKSGPGLSAADMTEGVMAGTSDWMYDAVSIGYPGLLRKGKPVRDPSNLGEGWLNFDFDKAFGKPVRMINDAAMQALGNYVHGRLLFLGFGTSIGTCVIADDIVIPIEIGMIKFSKTERFLDRLSKEALKEGGIKMWLEAVQEAVELLRDVFHPDETVLGGGNAKLIDPMPGNCRLVNNTSAYVGAERLWEDADLYAVADGKHMENRPPRKSGSMNSAKTVEDYLFDETGEIPNNLLLPLLIYRGAVQDSNDLAGRFEKLFQANNWQPAWRFGIYDFPHYHSTAHEVIGVYRGRAKVLFGHTGGITTWLEQGDVVVIPAGVGHEGLEASPDFDAVGGYPLGQQPDVIQADAREMSAARKRIDDVPLPVADPVHGRQGPLTELW